MTFLLNDEGAAAAVAAAAPAVARGRHRFRRPRPPGPRHHAATCAWPQNHPPYPHARLIFTIFLPPLAPQSVEVVRHTETGRPAARIPPRPSHLLDPPAALLVGRPSHQKRSRRLAPPAHHRRLWQRPRMAETLRRPRRQCPLDRPRLATTTRMARKSRLRRNSSMQFRRPAATRPRPRRRHRRPPRL